MLLVGTNSHSDAILSVFPGPGRRPSPAGSVLLSGWLAGEFPADHVIQSPDNPSIGQRGTGGPADEPIASGGGSVGRLRGNGS